MAEDMDSTTCSEAKRSYSWWWDSHITPKNSKWLQENLTNMDNKVKSMIKLIEEDADSFARRAEMYYKKRPELMKLVEEFYRAYRALAERYDHLAGELRHAHRTIAVAFPNQIQLILPDEPPSGLPDSVEEGKESFCFQSYSEENGESLDENNSFMSKEEWKHLNHDKFAEGLLMNGLNIKDDVGKNSEIKNLQEEISKLSIEINNLKNRITSESMRADKSETKLNFAEERCLDLEKKNNSLRFEMSKLNEAVSRKMEEVSNLYMENQNLHNVVKMESRQAEQAEVESCRLRDAISKLNSELGTSLLHYKSSQERISDLEAEIRLAGDQLQNLNAEMSIRSSKLDIAEEQYLVLQEENKSLQSTIGRFEIVVAKQEEEVILREEEVRKLKQFIEDERRRYKYGGIHENMSLQMELNKFKQRIRGQEDELAARGKEVEKLKQSLEDERQRRIIAEVDNQSLKKLFSQSEEKAKVLNLEIQSGAELLRRMELSKIGLDEEIKRLHDENNDLKEKSFSSLSKIVGLQDEIDSARRSKFKITDELSFHLDENKSLQLEIYSLKNERNNSEERHHELIFEFEGLRKKVKALEESYESVYHQNCSLITENNTLVSQVEKIEQHMESLENRFSIFEGKHANTDNENDHWNHLHFFKNQTIGLNNQIRILKERNQYINEEFEEGLHKTVKCGIDLFIMKQILCDINEKNLILSDECQKYMDKLSCAEKLTLELKHDLSTQEKKLALLLEHNKKLSVMAFDAKEDSEPNKEFHHVYLEKSPSIVLLEQLGLSLVELRATKSVLEQESVKKNEEISLLHCKSFELMELNEQLRKDLHGSNQQKEELNIELEKMRRKYSDLQEAQCIFHGEIPKLFSESECISSKSFELREQTDSQEEEHEAILEEFLINEYLYCNFTSSDAEKCLGIDQLINDVYNLHDITNDLGQDIRVVNENMRALQTDNMHLRDLSDNFETKNSILLEGDNVNLECLMVELNNANVVREELERKILFLSEENVNKEDMIELLRQSNENFDGEISRLHKETEALRRREKNLISELLRVKDESRWFEEESALYLLDVNAASINELIFKEKIVELMLKVTSFEAGHSVRSEILMGEISPRNVRREDLMKKVDSSEEENKGMKAELTAYFPPFVSLDKDTASFEENSLSLADYHILSSKRRRGNKLLAPLRQKRFSQVGGKDDTSKVSAGIMELKRLHSKVKKLQKTMTNTERLLSQEETVTDTNSANETRKIKARRSKGSRSARQLETEKKKDIILDTRKSNEADKDVRKVKIEHEVSKLKHEHMLKDIELDHVLSSFRSRDDFSSETDEHHKADIMVGETSAKSSFELVLEKEFSVDKLELPIDDAESHPEWSRMVNETLSSDSLRLSILHENLEELKKTIEVSEMSSQSSKTIIEQLRICEGVIKQLIDVNFKLTKMVDNFSANLDDNEGRRRVSDRVQIASEKIDVVELELENAQFTLSKLMEEQESKAHKASQRKSKFPLKDFILWKRNDSRQKKRRFCACMRLNSKGD